MSGAQIQKALGVLVVGFIVFVFYFGTYLPMRKSQVFIESLKKIRSTASFEELKSVVSVPLDLRSPVGQEELVRNFTNIALDLASRSDDPAAMSQILDFVDLYFTPIIKKGSGMSFGQNLYLLGALNEVVFLKTKDGKYFEKAKFYFEKGHELGPKRPQPLYGLLDIYRIEGNIQKTQEIAEQILSQWPNDERTKAALADFLERIKQGDIGQPTN